MLSISGEQMMAPYKKPQLIVYGSVRNLTGGSKAAGADANGTQTLNAKSDRSVKENIIQVGRHPAGYGLYLFDYIPEVRDTWGHGRQFGVMADEIRLIVPEAVSTDDLGEALVDYGKLGITRH